MDIERDDGDLSESDEPSPFVQNLDDQDDSPSSSAQDGEGDGEGEGASDEDSSSDEDEDEQTELDGDDNGGSSLLIREDGDDAPTPAVDTQSSRLPSPSMPQSPSSSSPTSHSATPQSAQTRAQTPAQPDASAYLLALAARHARFAPPSRLPLSYSIEHLVTFPLACHVHAIALSPCCSNLYTGGSDGFVRRYALFPTLNGNAVPGPNNYMMKQGGHAPVNVDKYCRHPVLVGYWENEEPGSWVNDLHSAFGPNGLPMPSAEMNIRWGPKAIPRAGQSPVYSLALQKDEIWGLSGTGVSRSPTLLDMLQLLKQRKITRKPAWNDQSMHTST